MIRGLARPAVAIALAALACTACSGDPEPGPTTPADSGPSTPAASPAPDAKALIGQITVTEEQAAACGSDQAPSQSALLPGGLLIEQCGTSELIGMSALDGSPLWRFPLEQTDTSRDDVHYGTRHVFIIRTTHTEATGLADAFDSRQLIALDPTAGRDVWTVPLEEFVPKTDRSSGGNATVIESGGGTSGLTPQVMVHLDAWTDFDASSGDELWHRTDLSTIKGADSGTPYVGDGLFLATTQLNGRATATAYDGKTGQAVWNQRIPSGRPDDGWQLDGTTIWQVDPAGINALNVVNGNVVQQRQFPAEWTAAVADHEYALARTGANLIMVSLNDLNTPIWSQPVGESVQPIAVTKDTAVVSAQSGVQILDASPAGQGLVRSGSPTLQGVPRLDVVDGLALLPGGAVLELSPPAGSVS